MSSLSEDPSNPHSVLDDPPVTQQEGASTDSGRYNISPSTPSQVLQDTLPVFMATTEEEQCQTTTTTLFKNTLPQMETSQKKPLNLGIQAENRHVPSSLLTVPVDSPLFRRHWVSSDSPDSENDDPMAVLDKFNKAMSEASNAGSKLRHCIEKTVREKEDNSKQLVKTERELETSRKENEDLKLCEQDIQEYKQKCAKVAITEKAMTEYYKGKLHQLEKQLEMLSKKKDLADKEHMNQVDSLEQKHTEEKASLKCSMQTQFKYCQMLEKELKERDSKQNEFEDIRSRVKERQNEVKQLHETLKEREKELQDLETELKTKATEVEKLKMGVEAKEVKIRELKVDTMTKERDTVEEQLGKCKEIRQLVERLPNITNREDLDRITRQINDDITRMKATTTHQKSISWR